MEAIFSCKLYRTSPRKEKIAAALASSVNAELVQQLNGCLSDEVEQANIDNYRAKHAQEEAPKRTETESYFGESNAPASERSESDAPRSFAGNFHPTGHTSASLDFGPDAEDTDSDSDEAPSSVPEIDTVEEADNDSENHLPIYGVDEDDIDCNSIKDQLNGSEGTSGVMRVEQRILDGYTEIWVYYDDTTNLNIVMTDVINAIASIASNSLAFNRLARSENAIVFQVVK